MSASEIRALAGRAGIAPGVSVLDLCCGVAGPGRLITAEFGCTYLGVDYSASAIDIARASAGDLPCRFEVSRIPPVPPGPFDVVLLLETMLAFADKDTLVAGISAARLSNVLPTCDTGARAMSSPSPGVGTSMPLTSASTVTPIRSGRWRQSHFGCGPL